METFITILAVCLIIYLLSLFMKILPYLFILLGTMLFIFLLYRLYEYIFFHSEKFLNIKKRISTVVCDYNEMNEHIERLKDTKLVSHDVRYGESNDKNLNKLSSKRIFFKDKKYSQNVYDCSSTVCNNARKKPYEYVCKYFNIRANKSTLSDFEDMLNNFAAVEDGKQKLQAKKQEALSGIENEIPLLIKKFGRKRLEQQLGFKPVDLSADYFPKFVFKDKKSSGKNLTSFEVVMDISNLNAFVLYLSNKIKCNKSGDGQRELMTSSLRKKIIEHDHYTCRQCGATLEKDPHLLLEVDYIVSLSKGGSNAESNLQTLCWRCSNKKCCEIENEV